MNKQIVLIPIGTDPKSTLPPLLSRADDLTRAMLANGREVEPEFRASLQAHLDRLNLWLGGCDEEDVIPHVSVMRSVMSRNQTTPAQEDKVLLAYCMILKSLPAWAIKRACEDFMHGRAGDGRFAPTPAEIAARCRTLMARYVEDRVRIERALGAADRRDEGADLA